MFPYYTLTELFPQLEDRHLDLIAAGVSVTPERIQQFRFGPAYQDVSQKLVFKQGNERPREVEDLVGSLTIISGSSHAETLRNAKVEHAALTWQETDEKDTEELLEMVLADELDYTVADSNILAVIRRRHPELSIGFTINDEQGIAWALIRIRTTRY